MKMTSTSKLLVCFLLTHIQILLSTSLLLGAKLLSLDLLSL